jgi:hypothetical protein
MTPQKAPPQTELRDDLYFAVKGYWGQWKNQTIFYATLSVVFHGGLIVASAIVAAQKLFEAGSKPSEHSWLFPSLSVMVAVMTGLDGRLKPRVKWNGFMTVRDEARAILDEVSETPQTDGETLKRLRGKLEELLKYHRAHNVN